MKFAAVLVVIALQSALRNTFVARAQQSGNATLVVNYPLRVMTAPNQLCPSKLNREDVRSQIKEDIQSILRNNILPQLNLEGNSETNPAASCSELLGRGQNSGYYWIRANSTSAVQVYCDMNRRCCNSSGGWMRVAYLNTTDPTQQCPDGWRELTTPIRTCRRANGSYINTVVFNTSGILYNRVCGRIIGYQFGTPEAFRATVTIQVTTFYAITMWMEFQLHMDKGAREGISGLLLVPRVRVIKLMFAHAQPAMLLPSFPPG